MILRVVGIDAAFNNFGIVQAYYNTETKELEPYRLQLVVTHMPKNRKGRLKCSINLARAQYIQKQYMRNCVGMDYCAAEIPSGSQSAAAGHALGIVVGILASNPIPLIEVTPTQVKLAATGDSTATKTDMIDWAVSLYPNLNWPIKSNGGILKGQAEHLADAIAVLHAAIITGKLR